MNILPAARRTRLLLIALLAVAATVGAALMARGGGGPESFRTARPARGEIASTVTSSGTINPVVTVTVGTPVSGIVQAIYADYNALVKKGQVIARIDPATYQAQVEQNRGNVLNAQAGLDKARVTLADAARTRQRYENLVKDGSVSRSDYDTYATAEASARAAVQAAQGALAQAQGSYRQAKTNLDYTTITSPVDGIVISRSVEVGQTVAASLQAPTLFTIAQDLTKMQIYATVDESDIGRINEGGNTTFSVDAYPETRFSGTVTQVRNAATTVSNVVTYTVVVGVDNAELKLKPGMTASVVFQTAHRPDALKIPTAALRFKPQATGEKTAEAAPRLAQGQKRLYVLREGKPVPVAVTVGIGNDKETEVLTGLGDGDEVVLESLGTQKKGSTSPLGMAGGMGPPR